MATEEPMSRDLVVALHGRVGETHIDGVVARWSLSCIVLNSTTLTPQAQDPLEMLAPTSPFNLKTATADRQSTSLLLLIN